jgi:hypothetical protein
VLATQNACWRSFAPFSVRLPRVRLCHNSGAIADVFQLPLGAEGV